MKVHWEFVAGTYHYQFLKRLPSFGHYTLIDVKNAITMMSYAKFYPKSQHVILHKSRVPESRNKVRNHNEYYVPVIHSFTATLLLSCVILVQISISVSEFNSGL